MTRAPFTESDVRPGDWVRFRDPITKGGVERIAAVKSIYPFGRSGEHLADTTLGLVNFKAILEVRRHACNRLGGPKPVVDESRDTPITGIYPTCSVCGVPQVFSAPDSDAGM